MALPNFLTKAAKAASQVLQGYSNEMFEQILLRHNVCLAFDKNATDSQEGVATLDLSVRLLARLYPNLEVKPLSEDLESYKLQLGNLARAINPDISLDSHFPPTMYLVVGECKLDTDVPVFYIGSDNWVAKFSDTQPVSSGNTDNSLAAGAAACFGVANVFRSVFKDHLPGSTTDTSFSISLVDYQVNINKALNPSLTEINIGNVHLVGLGAIGNSFIWSISRIASLKGELMMVDSEEVDLSNLQRYVLTTQENIGQRKTTVAAGAFESTKMKVDSYPGHWGPYMKNRNNWNLETIAVAVDSAEDRILIQSSLPKTIFNSWTQLNDLGVSRHADFINEPCLACLYLPAKKKLSYSQEVATNLGLSEPKDEEFIRKYLALNLPVDQTFIEKIAAAKNVPVSDFLPHIGQLVQGFYNQMICGGMLMNLSNDSATEKGIEVPLAFQSSMAGIMLAAEVILHAGSLRTIPFKTRSRFNMLKPVTRHNSENCDKLIGSNCFCQDDDYKSFYLEKYSE